MAHAAATVVLPLTAAVLLAQGLWWVLQALRPGYADNPFVYRPLLYQVAVAGLAALALLGWYLPRRRKFGPAALACGALAWLALLGILTAAFVPGTSHLFTLPLLGCAVGALAALLVARPRSAWPVAAITVGLVPAVVLLMPLGVDTFDAMGLASGGVAAALLTLFGLTLLPLIEQFLPANRQPLGRDRGALVAVAGIVLVLALTGAGLAVDRIDVAHPRRADLAYLLDTDTGRASWLSRDAEPAPWTRRYVTERFDDPERAAGLADDPVWLGPAPAVLAAPPDVTLRSRQSDAINLHISSPRSAPTVVLRVDQPVDAVTVTAPGLAPTTVDLEGTRPGRWPAEVRFGDLPVEGIDVRLQIQQQTPLRIAAYDLTYGLAEVPGFVPRPPGVERSPRPGSDAVVVARTYEF